MKIDWNPVPKPRGDVTKLPKWAQGYIELLQRYLRESEDATTRLVGDASEEPGSVSFTDHLRPARPIPPGHKIYFHFAPRVVSPSYISARYLDDQFNGDGVEVGADRRILIEPRATNLVYVRLEER